MRTIEQRGMVYAKFVAMSKINRFLSKEVMNHDAALYNADDVRAAYTNGATETLEELKNVLSISEEQYLRENINKMIKYLEGEE